MKTFSISRKTRKLGWGYTNWLPENQDGPKYPETTGTIKQVFDYIDNCKDYKFAKSGGTYLVEGWFYNGKPIKFIDDTLSLTDAFEALNMSDFGGEYMWETVDVQYA